MTAILTRTAPIRIAVGAIGLPSGDKSVSPVLIPLLRRVAETLCKEVTDGMLCESCSDEVRILTSHAIGTGTMPLSESDLRAVLTHIATQRELDLFGLGGQVSVSAYCVASMTITRHLSTIASAPIDRAIAAAADTCLIAYDVYAAAPLYRGGLLVAERAVNTFRVQAGMLARTAAER